MLVKHCVRSEHFNSHLCTSICLSKINVQVTNSMMLVMLQSGVYYESCPIIGHSATEPAEVHEQRDRCCHTVVHGGTFIAMRHALYVGWFYIIIYLQASHKLSSHSVGT